MSRNYIQYAYYKFECVVLDKPKLMYTDPFFLRIYLNSCLSYDTAFTCGINIEPSKDNVLKISTQSKRTYATDIVGYLKCLSYLLNSRIAITRKHILYEDTILDPTIFQPEIEHECIFYDCRINSIKAHPLLKPEVLLHKNTVLSLSANTVTRSNFTNMLRFISHFNITHYVSQTIQYENNNNNIDCNPDCFNDVLIKYIKSGDDELAYSSYKEVWKQINKDIRMRRILPDVYYPIACPVLKYVDKKQVRNLRLLSLIDESLYKKELENFIDKTKHNLTQKNIVSFLGRDCC